MTEIGVRALKARLSEFLSQAADGEDIVVTDRGRPIVRLVAFRGHSAVDRGIEEGWIEPARRSSLPPVERVRSSLSTLQVLDEDRG